MSDPDNNPPESEDFGAMLEAFGNLESVRLNLGDKIDVKILHIAGSNVFCEISPTQEGVVPVEDLSDEDGKLQHAVGDSIALFVVGLRDGIELRQKIGKGNIDIGMLEAARESGMPVEGTVTGVNKGGLEIAIGGARGFCPIGQADIEFVDDPKVFVGQTLQFRVKKVEERGRNVVLNRRELLDEERQKQAAVTLAELEEGQRIDGVVTRVLNFGAFVDIGGIEGLIPVSELAWERVASAEGVINTGERVSVEVMRIEPDPKRPGRQRIGLSLKAAQPDPFFAHADALQEGSSLNGQVVRLEQYGAFVRLYPGVQGLIHISELAFERVRHPEDVLAVGDEVSVRVLGLDLEQRRVSLSLKAAVAAAHYKEGDALAPGMAVEGKVNRIEHYGVFVTLAGGESALLPAAETGTARGTDLGRVFPIETELSLQVIAIDDQGRVKVSKTAREKSDERTVVEDYNTSQSTSGKGFGTLGDLLAAKSRRR